MNTHADKKVLYPETSRVIKEAILENFPTATPDEYRAEWRDNFKKFRRNPWRVACRLLWMLKYMESEEFKYSNNPADFSGWMGQICGIMEGLGWIDPGVFIGALHTDHSSGNDELG